MKILVVARSAWNINTNFGNTFTSLFEGTDDVTIAHLCFGSGSSDNDILSACYQVTEKDIVQKLTGKKKTCGKPVDPRGRAGSRKSSAGRKIPRLTLLYAMRDAIWSTGLWKTDELRRFLDEFSPDIIFAPLYSNIYMNKIEKYIASYCKVPLVSFVSDDVYSLRQFRLSPVFWIYRLIARGHIRKTVGCAQKLYTISDMQKNEYTHTFGKECSLLYKSADFTQTPGVYEPGRPYKIVYTGNLSSGRWKTVAELAKAIREINRGDKLFELDIYSLTKLSKKQENAVAIPGASRFLGPLEGRLVAGVQGGADILLHCESFRLKDKYEVRLSFSTKIVDYLKTGKCIMAIGPADVASMRYLADNNAALVINDTKKIPDLLANIANNPSVLSEYGKNAWKCGRENHSRETVNAGFYSELFRIAKGAAYRSKNESTSD